MAQTRDGIELSREQIAWMIEQATHRILDHLDAIDEPPVENTAGGIEMARRLREPLPKKGAGFDELMDLLFHEAIPCSFTTPSPGFMAYIPGGGIPHAAVADLIADTTNRFVPVWAAAPGLNQLEANVVSWFCEIVGYPESAGGVLTPGGSLANLIALVTARSEQLGEAFLDGTVYTSDQTHNSMLKAARFAGIPRSNVRSIPTDEAYRIELDALEAAITRDLDEGFEPFLINGNAGTTNTGAIDDLEALADVAEAHGLWFHADAAYGGFFVLTDDGRERLSGMERADSITLDPHKGLCLPYGTGALVVRDSEALERTHAEEADYLPDTAGTELSDFSRLSPELSRDFRGLRVWLPLKMHGIGPFRENLEEKLELTRHAAKGLSSIEHVRLVNEPELTTFGFRLEPPGVQGEALDELNRAFQARINEIGRVQLSGTVLGGRFTPRVSILVFRTHQEHVDHLIEDARRAASQVLGEHA